MISYRPLWDTLKKKNISTYALINKYNINSSTINRMRNNKNVSTETLNAICFALQCEISDVVEYIPHPDDAKS